MMATQSITEHILAISNLSLADFVIYYFFIYVSIVSVQKTLGIEIDTGGRIRTNPKVLATLIVLYSYTHIAYLTRFIFESNDQIVVGFISVSFLIILLTIFEKVIFGKNGLVCIIFSSRMNNMAETQIKHEAEKNNRVAEKIPEKITLLSVAHKDKYKLFLNQFTIEVLVWSILAANIFPKNVLLGISFTAYAIFFHKKSYLQFKKINDEINRTMSGSFTRILQ